MELAHINHFSRTDNMIELVLFLTAQCIFKTVKKTQYTNKVIFFL